MLIYLGIYPYPGTSDCGNAWKDTPKILPYKIKLSVIQRLTELPTTYNRNARNTTEYNQKSSLDKKKAFQIWDIARKNFYL